MKKEVLTDFHLINEIARAFYEFSFFHLQVRQWRLKCIVEIVHINNLGFKVLTVNFAFKYEKRQLNFLWL